MATQTTLTSQGLKDLEERLEHLKSVTRKEIAEKIQLIKIQNNCKSLNETLEQLIPKTVNENYEFIKEQPIFTIKPHFFYLRILLLYTKSLNFL